MYSIIPEAWNIQTCKCLIDTVAYTWWRHWRRRIFSNVLEYSRVLHNVCMTGERTQCVTCKVYWNANVPRHRAKQKIIRSEISYEIFTVSRYSKVLTSYSQSAQEIPFIWNAVEIDGTVDNSNIRRTVTDGPFAMQICQSVLLILWRKIHTVLSGWSCHPDSSFPLWAVVHDVLLVVHDVLRVFHNVLQVFNDVLQCLVSHATIAGIGDNSTDIGNNATGIGSIATKVIPCSTPSTSNSVPGRQFPNGAAATMNLVVIPLSRDFKKNGAGFSERSFWRG